MDALNHRELGVPMGVIDLSEMDTAPGNNNPFSPPAHWAGSQEDYIELMRSRNRSQDGFQQFFVAARQRIVENDVTFSGPFNEVADKMLNSLCANILNGSLT